MPETSDRRFSTAILVGSLVLAACGGSDTALPTHGYDGVGDAELTGNLNGTTDCLWVGDDPAGGIGLVFPERTTARDTNESLVEVSIRSDRGLRFTALTGTRVSVEGAVDNTGRSSFLENVEPVWLVDAIGPCTPDECDDD